MLLLGSSFAIVSAVVLAALLWPLWRRSSPNFEPAAADLAVYRDQLAEIDADLARGLIGNTEAEAARRELARRLIARDGKAASGSAVPDTAVARGAGFGSYPILIAVIALLPAVAILLHQVLGAPGLPAQPYRERMAAPVERTTVDDLIARVEVRLREHPEDGQGWDVIAPVYLRQERYREAADAFANAIRLVGPTAKRLSGFAEASVLASNGVIGEDARLAYEQALKLEPDRVDARFWLAMAKEQDGALADAAADYRALLAGAPPNAAWRGAVDERLAGITQRLSAPAGEGSTTGGRGLGAAPDAGSAAAIERLAPDERMKAIASMVDGLAARLQRDGSDLDGWLRLMRAYKVLGRHDAAVTALGDARKAMQGNAAALAELDALAKSLGMGS